MSTDTQCTKFIIVGAVSVVLTILAFVSGANALGIVLVATAIATFGYGAGSIMNSSEPPRH